MKKIIALVLAVIMAFSAVPMLASAAGTKTEEKLGTIRVEEFVKMTDAQKAEYLGKVDTSKVPTLLAICVYLSKAINVIEKIPKVEFPALRHFVYALAEKSLRDSTPPLSKADIIAIYNDVYNTTKATGKFTGSLSIKCEYFNIENGMIKVSFDNDSFAPRNKNTQLPPYTSKNPGKTSLLTVDDIAEATYTYNKDGSATIKLVPIECKNSKPFADAQGRLLYVPEDANALFASNKRISWAQGDANANVNFTNKGGYAVVSFDTASKTMLEAEYVFVSYADIAHCNVATLSVGNTTLGLFKDENCDAKFVMTWTYPGV